MAMTESELCKRKAYLYQHIEPEVRAKQKRTLEREGKLADELKQHRMTMFDAGNEEGQVL